MTVTRKKALTLDEFTIQQLRMFPHATGELSSLLRDIGLAAKRIYAEVNKAGLADITGAAGYQNPHAESVQKLDEFAQHELQSVLKNGLSCAGIASEEMEDIEVFDDVMNNKSKYVVMFDPLDGSSNIETNAAIGTIFGIYRRKTAPGMPCRMEDFLQQGIQQVAAGYIIYGSSAMMVYATRRGVNGFTLDPAIGEFSLSHPDIHCPCDTQVYSVNQGYWPQFEPGVQEFIARCQQKNMSLRYAGSMVADMHRVLLQGGIFMYPATLRKPAGKLRLMYECNPFAFITEVAGGKASSGFERIVEIQPICTHQTSPVFMGSSLLVNELRMSLHKTEAFTTP